VLLVAVDPSPRARPVSITQPVVEDELAADPLLRAWASASAGSSSERVRRTGRAAYFLDFDISTSTSAAALAVSQVRPCTAMY